MTINRLLMSASAAVLGLTMATSAMAAPGGGGPPPYTPPIIADTGLGFGIFLGTWQQDPPSDSGMPNPSGNADNVVEVGNAILVAHPGLFDIDDFHLAGLADGYAESTGPTNSNPADTGFRVDSKIDGYTAKWTYDGFADAGIFPPGDDPVDLFIAVKYSTFISVFLFEFVDPNDPLTGAFGYLSSDYATILANTVDADEADLNYDGFTSDCELDSNDFSASCMMYNPSGNSPHGVSHVVAYWPPVDPSDIPEPASLTLLGAGLLGLGYFGKRRKAA